MWPLWLVEMSLQHIQKNSPRLLPKPAKFEKNPPNGYRVIRKTKCGAGGAWSSPIHKQASLAGRLMIVCTLTLHIYNKRQNNFYFEQLFFLICRYCQYTPLKLQLKWQEPPYFWSSSEIVVSFKAVIIEVYKYGVNWS